MNEKTPFRINYPLNLLKLKNINSGDKEIKEKIFKNNLFYYKYKKERNPFLEERYETFINLSKEISKFVRKKYPSLEILSISVFGSALFAKNPGDFDFLVIVKGNIFLLEKTKLTLGKNGENILYNVGISIKGLDNLTQGILDLKARTNIDKQIQVIDRTAISLFRRHLPLFGCVFIENKDEFSDNVYAQISDLLSNTYNLYYLKKERPHLNNQQRAKKILSRLYEAAKYLEFLEKDSEISLFRKEIYLNHEKGDLSFSESKKIFDRFKLLYLKRSQALRKEINEKISFSEDHFHINHILQRTKYLLSKKKIGRFLPVMAKIVDDKGRTVAFTKRIKKGLLGDMDGGSIHAEINSIRSAKLKKKTKWGNYTIYCSLEPCGNCAKKIAKLGIKKVVYILPDPLLFYYGRQREIYNKKKVLFYRHHSAKLTAKFQKIYSELYNKKFPKAKRPKILDVLSDERLRKNILERLEKYWKCIKLPHKWISPILEILSKYSYNEDLAIKEVRKKFPSLTGKNSRDYSKKLLNWRRLKVKRLAKRVEKYVVGKIICDVGGRKGDFTEEILKLKKSVKKAYVTDIDSFSKNSKNHKINFIVQSSNTKWPFGKKRIDTIILSMVLHHLGNSDQKDLVKKIVSSLNAKGIVILIEDTYPQSRNFLGEEKNINEFLKFNSEEKEEILSFYDWFGNRLMRNRDNTPLAFNYKTIEEWEVFFKKYGMEQIISEFVKANISSLDLFPPKAVMVFRKKN